MKTHYNSKNLFAGDSNNLLFLFDLYFHQIVDDNIVSHQVIRNVLQLFDPHFLHFFEIKNLKRFFGYQMRIILVEQTDESGP